MIRKNSVCWIGAHFDACALWRVYMPHFSYPRSTFHLFAQRPELNRIVDHDICIVQRCLTAEQARFIQIVKQCGMRVVYDLDDNMWQIPDFNPAAGILGRYKIGFENCMALTDVITVSTSTLASVVQSVMRKHFKVRKIPVVVTQNRIDTRLFAPPRKSTEEVIVGWAGSTSHLGDLEIAQDALETVAQEEKDVVFEFRGMAPPEKLRELKNVRFRLWQPVSDFMARMPVWGWSVALAPLCEHDFNKSKSPIKMMEAAYCKIPCLVSWLEPYAYFCSFDPELKWLLCASSKDWAPKLRTLLHEPAMRNELGRRAYNVLIEHFSFSKPHEGWDKAFALALNGI